MDELDRMEARALMDVTVASLQQTLQNLMMSRDVTCCIARTDDGEVVSVQIPPMFARRLMVVLHSAAPSCRRNFDGTVVEFGNHEN